MAKLVLSMDGVVIGEYSLNRERTTLGRKANNDIQVDNLAVSGEHAVILTLINDSFIEDLNSTNGTFVNGKPVRRHLLHHGDIIELGKHKLRYVNDGKGTDSVADYERTLAIRSSGSKKPAEPSAEPLDIEEVRRSAAVHPLHSSIGEPGSWSGDTVVALENAPAIGVIQVLNGTAAGRALPLSKDLTTIGKAGGDVAVVTRRPKGYFITPVEGNPPLLNGKPLDVQPHPLKDHDIIELAGVKLEFYLEI